ncbi:MAG: SMP-30/gluconolactonase/LRE family protein [Spirochaetota bacterium]
MEPELILDLGLEIGENPVWHPGERCLYFEDIPAGRIFRWNPAAGGHEVVFEGGTTGGFTIQQDGSLLLFVEDGGIQRLRAGTLERVVEEIPRERGTRFNDVIADPEGRVYCGTMPGNDGAARLYRLETDGSIHLVQEGIGLSNGMGFSPDLKRMYHTDSRKRRIYVYEYERETGQLRNLGVFARVPEGEGVPDGMTVDSEGCVWSARWDGGCVVRYAPDGTEILRVGFPVRKVSSVTFGGGAYTELYATTAGGGGADEGPGAGGVFRVMTGCRGVPEFLSGVALCAS